MVKPKLHESLLANTLNGFSNLSTLSLFTSKSAPDGQLLHSIEPTPQASKGNTYNNSLKIPILTLHLIIGIFWNVHCVWPTSGGSSHQPA
jgi:hypothetical protein